MAELNEVENYIVGFPAETQKLLQLVRKTIADLAPQATEKISYAIPTFDLYGNLVHYAGYKNHIGFYPGSSAIASFKSEIADYKSAKGSIQFPLNKPVPIALITKITQFCINQNIQKSLDKKSLSKKKANFEDGFI